MHTARSADCAPAALSGAWGGVAAASTPKGQGAQTGAGPAPTGRLLVLGGVLLLHGLLLWALQAGLLRRVVEVVVPVQFISQASVPQAQVPQPVPPPPAPVRSPVAAPAPAPNPSPVQASTPTPTPAPLPLAVAGPAAPSAPTGAVQSAAPATSPAVAAPATAPTPAPAPVAPPKDEAPQFAADYLHNPTPAYPPMSNKLGERGLVLVRVLVGEDGLAQKAEVKTSSGFERLDRAALNAVLKWRYVPGKRAGAALAMWVLVPVNFGLE